MIKAQIPDDDLQLHLNSIEKDGITMFVMAGNQLRGALLNGTRMINQMRANEHTGILETMVLGQAELCAALLLPTMKGREHVTFRYDTNGPAAGFSVEADSTGYVRGYLLQNSIPVEKPLENWDLEPFFGEGTLTVSRQKEDSSEPQTGTTEIRYKNIAKDLTWYFAQSEQIKTAFITSIQMDKQGRVVGAGGLFLQVVPETGGNSPGKSYFDDSFEGNIDDIAAKVEKTLGALPSLGQWFSEKGTRDDLIYGLFREFKPLAVLQRNIRFDCPCSAEHFAQSIRNLGKNEVDDILEKDPDPLEVTCHNCGSIYQIPKSMLR
jgi:molecular chaperone Hsp33